MRICRNDFIKRPRRVVHPRHHCSDIKHLARCRVQFLHQILVMPHHVPLERIVDVSIQVEGTVKVILKARNWVMAKNHCSTAVLHFEILCDLNKLPQELVVIAPVMVPFNNANLKCRTVYCFVLAFFNSSILSAARTSSHFGTRLSSPIRPGASVVPY